MVVWHTLDSLLTYFKYFSCVPRGAYHPAQVLGLPRAREFFSLTPTLLRPRPRRERSGRRVRRVLGVERQRRVCRAWGWGRSVDTHSKCFLIFSDSAYLEIPLMKRVRFTWRERQVRGTEDAGRGGESESREEQTEVGGALVNF